MRVVDYSYLWTVVRKAWVLTVAASSAKRVSELVFVEKDKQFVNLRLM